MEEKQKHDGKITIYPEKPIKSKMENVSFNDIELSSRPDYKSTDLVATRYAYGTALEKLANSCSRVIALDGDTKNSTFSEFIKKVDPSRYIECFIAEQNLVGVAIGAACRNRTIPFVSTFSAFFTRAFDQVGRKPKHLLNVYRDFIQKMF